MAAASTEDLRAFAASLAADLPTLDIHGRRPNEIAEQIDVFLYQSAQRKQGSVQIIYGIGTGVLGVATHDFLRRHPLVENVLDKGAYCIVLLKR